MVKIPHFLQDETKRLNLGVEGYAAGIIPALLKREIDYHWDKTLQLRKDNNIFYDLYIPDFHPVITTNLLHHHNLIEWTNIDTKKREFLYLIETRWVEDIRDVLPEYNLSEKITGKYLHIRGVHISSEPVLRISGVSPL